MTSATERLRALLDERGVEWTEPTDEYWELLGGIPTRNYVTIIGEKCVEEALDGTLVAYPLTPEQAVTATLGPGTCRIGRGISGLMHVTTGHCSECGAEVVKPARYCANCGRKVEP